MSNVIPITDHRGEPRVDTRLLADRLELQHASVFKLVQGYESDFAEFGKVRFEIGPTASGQQQRYALLNEDQSYLLLTFSRNTPTVRELKVALVKAFRAARVAREAVETDYLPGYHELHEIVGAKASKSANERFVHMNVNKLVNKTVGIDAGKRRTIPAPIKARVIVAQEIAALAFQAANDHHDGYEKAKGALETLSQALIGNAA